MPKQKKKEKSKLKQISELLAGVWGTTREDRDRIAEARELAAGGK